jgi:hypothetical protein
LGSTSAGRRSCSSRQGCARRETGPVRAAGRAGQQREGWPSGRKRQRPGSNVSSRHRARAWSRGGTRETNEEEGKPDDREKKSDSTTESEDLGLQFRMVQGEDLGGDDRARTSADPAGRSRARNSEVLEQARVVLLAHEVAHPVVICPTAGGGKHGAWLLLPRRRATLADAESLAVSRVLQLRARNSRMSSFAAGQ